MSKLKIYIKFNFMAFILIITIFNKLVMMIRGKGDKDIVYGTCKSHINRSENDLYKICPSKLSKQELEDLYFALFESNIQLKKTLNGQKDEIKVLTTKVQRLTATGNRNQACCAKSSAVINEQKELISDLNKSNGQLSERIRLLNMRLCSAKQFLRRGTSQSTSRCSKCCLAFNTSIKNSSMSALYTKRSVANVGIEATSCDFLDKENIPVKLIEIASNQNEIKSAREENCHQNKCRTTIDELKEKISILEEELIKTHDQYSERLNKSIEEVAALKNENTRARSEAAAAEQHLQAQHRHLLELLRAQELRADDLEAQLMVERGKVSELEMRLKSADLSRHVAKTLEKQYTSSIGFPTVPNNDQVILDQIVSLQAELASLKHSLKYQKEALKQEHTSNSDNVLKQKSIHGTSSELDNGHFASRIGGIENVNAHLSVLREGDEGANVDLYKERHREIDEYNSKDLIQDSTGNVSRIPRLKNYIRDAITELINNESHRNSTIHSNNIDNETTETLPTSDYSNENKIGLSDGSKSNKNGNDDEIHNEVNNRRSSSTICNSELKRNSDDVTRTISNKQLSADSSKHKTVSQTRLSESNATNIEKNVDSRDSSNHQNEGVNEPYVDKIKVESPKSREDLKAHTDHNVDRIDSNEIERYASDKRRTSYVIETKSVKEKLTKVSSDDHLGSKTYSLGPKKPAPLATSSPQDRTYRRGSAGVLRASSPDSTEGEISSLTDLPDETDDKSPFDYMSPGERGGSTSRLSTSLLSDTSLSEGELCPASNSSCNDINEKFDITCRDSSMQEALRAAGAEVSRCRRLLRSHTRAPTDVDSVSGYPYNYTLPLI
ncbi:coiled-coil domain-containing protein 73-like isoform X2 [Nymphalis io]|uniref:coiled-coil domain-containing protein 73-like isoform X2 n=1 Tax=Inachis io TaxID=171585 RepID=UPI0021689995|nr:coiled-coil domain-containing protein 73-like isoform X2 [Nymphalis io]